LSFGTLKISLNLFSIEKKTLEAFKNPFVTKNNLSKKYINSQIKKLAISIYLFQYDESENFFSIEFL
jgi:hypothetical protein